MSGRELMPRVAATLVLLTVTEAIIVDLQLPTAAPADLRNCSQSVKLIPTLRLVAPDPTISPPPPARDTTTTTTTTTLHYSQPHGITAAPHTTTTTTTTTLHYSQPHGTTAAPHTTTTSVHPQQLRKTRLAPKKQAKPKSSQHPKKHHDLRTTTLDAPQLSPHVPHTINALSTSPLPYHHATVPQPDLPSRTSTLPPPSPAMPLPTAPPSPTEPMPRLALHQLGENMKNLFKRIPLALTSGWAKQFQTPYLERIRAVNHEMVDKVLQAELEEYEPDTLHVNTSTTNTSCHLLERKLSHLFQRETLILLLLQALPQSLEEVEEAMWNPEITDYIFRPEKKALFHVYGCRECYALDASGVCREVFFCKGGIDVFSRYYGGRPSIG